MKKNFALLATGGTIASGPTAKGLAPAKKAEDILKTVPLLMKDAVWSAQDVFQLDSSNIQPEEWCVLAQKTYDALKHSDGVLITHGTDTMAYTAAALSFMLQNVDKPVILTGSQLPLSAPMSDAPGNLLEAARALCTAPGNVYIYFHHKLILGTRAVKLRTTAFDAFDSVNAPLAGFMDADGLHLNPLLPVKNAPFTLQNQLSSKVFLLKLMPGTSPEIFDWVIAQGYEGVVIEAFGLGGLHYIRRNLVDKLQRLTACGVITLVVTQCLYERANFSVYEVGSGFLSSHVFSGGDMTTEAAVAKLCWVLGDKQSRSETLEQDLCGEMNPLA